jgi:hypothetical protein
MLSRWPNSLSTAFLIFFQSFDDIKNFPFGTDNLVCLCPVSVPVPRGGTETGQTLCPVPKFQDRTETGQIEKWRDRKTLLDKETIQVYSNPFPSHIPSLALCRT